MFARDNGSEIIPPDTTGRHLVLLREDAVQAGVEALSDIVGLSVLESSDFDDGAVEGDQLPGAEAVVFDRLGVAVVEPSPDQTGALYSAAAEEEDAILLIEPERVVYALQEGVPGGAGSPATARTNLSPRLPAEYLRGYRDAVNHLVDKVLGDGGQPGEATGEAIGAANESELTWGIQVTKAAASRFSGQGVRVAVLDTGLDPGHPDFVGHSVSSRSFIPNQAVQDGHGIHCIGTACGPKQPGQLPRYGVAHGAEILAGKVLSNQGSGVDEGILAGMNWAVTNRCHIVSMSLGSLVQPGEGYSMVYERAARRALAAGTLIIAAAGNESDRPGRIAPVGRPANSPSVMAVAALDDRLRVAYFSNGGVNPQGGQVDIAGPGVQVRSSWPRPRLYHTISGTSMATPHVAGIAALHAEANPGARGRALWGLLNGSARRLTLPSRDAGVGLVQAP